jgi:hypothetical protein
VILYRAGKRWEGMTAWRTVRRGDGFFCHPFELVRTVAQERERAKGGFLLDRSALAKAHSAWIADPDGLRRDMAVLRLDAELQERMQRKQRFEETNARLVRLGYPPLKPIAEMRARATYDRAGGGEVIYGGPLVRRPIGHVIGVR